MGALPQFGLHDQDAIREISADICRSIEERTIPDDLVAEIALHLAQPGEQVACAVRSSATAEDLPTTSFAGQQDTYPPLLASKAPPG